MVGCGRGRLEERDGVCVVLRMSVRLLHVLDWERSGGNVLLLVLLFVFHFFIFWFDFLLILVSLLALAGACLLIKSFTFTNTITVCHPSFIVVFSIYYCSLFALPIAPLPYLLSSCIHPQMRSIRCLSSTLYIQFSRQTRPGFHWSSSSFEGEKRGGGGLKNTTLFVSARW